MTFLFIPNKYFVFQFSNDGHKVNHQLLSTCSKVCSLKKSLLRGHVLSQGVGDNEPGHQDQDHLPHRQEEPCVWGWDGGGKGGV